MFWKEGYAYLLVVCSKDQRLKLMPYFVMTETNVAHGADDDGRFARA